MDFRRHERYCLAHAENWLTKFLQDRGLTRANGQMLFRYRSSEAEYRQLQSLLNVRFGAVRHWSFHFDSEFEAALFVLFAAEWWRREYDGGAWRWSSILEALDASNSQLDPQERSYGVELGLNFWGHRPSADGKKFLGAIVAQGGLPLRLIARGDGAITHLLFNAVRKAQLLGWGGIQIEDYIRGHSDVLVQHLQIPEIYQLLAETVTTVLRLRDDFQLEGVENPVGVLDKVEASWRERFPISVDNDSVDGLLAGLVKAVSQNRRLKASYPIVLTRSLDATAAPGFFVVTTSLDVAGSMNLSDLAFAMQIPQGSVPPTFSIELRVSQGVQIAYGRQLLGDQSSTVLLGGKPRKLSGDAGYQELAIVLRGMGADLSPAITIPDGESLDAGQPWVFAEEESLRRFVGVGSVDLKEKSAIVVLPNGFDFSNDSTGVRLRMGRLDEAGVAREVFRVEGEVEIVGDEEVFWVHTGKVEPFSDALTWKGSRLWCDSSLPVFLGRPKLYRVDQEGNAHVVGDSEVQWVEPIRRGPTVESIRGYIGPIDAWWLFEGKRRRRYRMILLNEEASIRMISGQSEAEGSIDFNGWGSITIKRGSEIDSNEKLTQLGLQLSLSAIADPPAKVQLAISWEPRLPSLSLELPFPSSGGKFIDGEGRIISDRSTLTLKRANAAYVRVLDRNPNAPKKYRLEVRPLRSAEGATPRQVAVPMKIEADGVGLLRLFEIEVLLNGLLCESDELDAGIEVSLFGGASVLKTLFVNRYDIDLERELESIQLATDNLARISKDELDQIDLMAIPLVESNFEPVLIPQIRSEGQATGRWSLSSLAQGHSPWLIYSAEKSTLLVRPTLYVASGFDALPTLISSANTSCPLAEAMRVSDAQARKLALNRVLGQMRVNFDHVSWSLIESHYRSLKHLPLSTIDYWRILRQDVRSALTVVLRLSNDLPEIASRIQEELGLVWEVLSQRDLEDAFERMSAYLNQHLEGKLPRDVVHGMVASTFAKLGRVSEALDTQVHLINLQKTGQRGLRFENIVAATRVSSGILLKQFWMGQDSHLQRVLLRNHTGEENWPNFGLTEDILAGLQMYAKPEFIEYLYDLAKEAKLVWESGASSAKSDVANVPLLLGIFCQAAKDPYDWLEQENRLTLIRQIKAFDREWFDLGMQTGNFIAAKFKFVRRQRV